MQPAIKKAREGFVVTKDLFDAIQLVGVAGSGQDFLSRDPAWSVDFAPNGTRVVAGDIMTRKRYANTLSTIADEGADAFYKGSIAKSIVDAVQAKNGTMTLDDIRNYAVVIRNAPEINYRGYRVASGTAPSSGIVALSVLKILENYEDFFAPGNVNLSTHRMTEAIRFGYGQVCV